MKKHAWFIFLTILTVSCLDQPDCFRLSNEDILLSFRVMGFGASPDTLIKIQTNGTDYVFQKNAIVTQDSLKLNPLRSDQAFYFFWKNGTVDTINIGYKSQIQFVSDECGQKYVYSDLAIIGKSTFDSVRVVNPVPTDPASINIETFRCANASLAGVKFRKLKGTVESDSALAVNGVTTADGKKVYIANDTLTTFYLPLDKKSDVSTFLFALKNGTTETIAIRHTHTTSRSPIKTCDSLTVFQRLKINNTSTLEGDTVSTRFTKNTSTSVFTSTTDPAIVNLEIVLKP